jgi:hypothetical protein
MQTAEVGKRAGRSIGKKACRGIGGRLEMQGLRATTSNEEERQAKDI